MQATNKEKLEFWAGNPQVNLINGELEIYQFSPPNTPQFEKEVDLFSVYGCKFLCCTCVPVHLSVIELSQFISFEFVRIIKHIRVLKGPDSSSYIVVIKLASKKDAEEFVKEFHGKRFNFLDPECFMLGILQDSYIDLKGEQ